MIGVEGRVNGHPLGQWPSQDQLEQGRPPRLVAEGKHVETRGELRGPDHARGHRLELRAADPEELVIGHRSTLPRTLPTWSAQPCGVIRKAHVGVERHGERQLGAEPVLQGLVDGGVEAGVVRRGGESPMGEGGQQLQVWAFDEDPRGGVVAGWQGRSGASIAGCRTYNTSTAD